MSTSYKSHTEELVRKIQTGQTTVPQPAPVGGIKDSLPQLSDGEQIVKSYHVSTLSFPACNGYLTVTNMRVIFHGHANDSRIMNEVPVSAVSGISSFYGSNTNGRLVIIGGSFLLAGLLLLSYHNYIAGAITAVIGIAALLNAYRKAFILNIYSAQATGAPISVGEGARGGVLSGNSAIYAMVGLPTHETDAMMLEIGALIHDLQKDGDLAIAKWQNSQDA